MILEREAMEQQRASRANIPKAPRFFNFYLYFLDFHNLRDRVYFFAR